MDTMKYARVLKQLRMKSISLVAVMQNICLVDSLKRFYIHSYKNNVLLFIKIEKK
jgi:hypothetical protein